MNRNDVNNLCSNIENVINFFRSKNILKDFCYCSICNNPMREIKYKNIDNCIWICQRKINGIKH